MRTGSFFTADDFFRTGPETDGHELVRGMLVALPPRGSRWGEVCASAGYLIKKHLRTLGQGKVIGGGAGVVTRRNPDTVRAACVAVYLRADWEPPVGYTAEAADLIVEVRLPSQTWAQVVAKVSEYLAMGVRMVWVLDPELRRLTVFLPDQAPVTYAPENELDGGDVLPGFRCRVAEFFE